jgi:hypothetical protein
MKHHKTLTSVVRHEFIVVFVAVLLLGIGVIGLSFYSQTRFGYFTGGALFLWALYSLAFRMPGNRQSHIWWSSNGDFNKKDVMAIRLSKKHPHTMLDKLWKLGYLVEVDYILKDKSTHRRAYYSTSLFVDLVEFSPKLYGPQIKSMIKRYLKTKSIRV